VALREALPPLPAWALRALGRALRGGRRALRARASAHVLSWAAEARARGCDLELVGRTAWRHSAVTRTRAHVTASLGGGLGFSLAVERTLSSGSRAAAGATLAWGRAGGSLKFKVERGGFRLLLPVYLGAEPRAAFWASAAWALLSGGLRWAVVAPRRARRRARVRAARLAAAAQADGEEAEAAAAEARLRSTEALRIRGEEEEYDGTRPGAGGRLWVSAGVCACVCARRVVPVRARVYLRV
jgi:hypothetical protein